MVNEENFKQFFALS